MIQLITKCVGLGLLSPRVRRFRVAGMTSMAGLVFLLAAVAPALAVVPEELWQRPNPNPRVGRARGR